MKKLVLCLCTALSLCQAEDNGDSMPHTQAEATSHGFRKWSVPTVGIEGLASHSYSRFSGHAQFGKVRLTGAMVNSEGVPFGQVFTGWVFTPLNSEHTELFLEPQIGTAITESKTRLALGLRALYASPNWYLESWITKFPGPDGWTNCEPLADVMHKIYKGLYAGAVLSCYAGTLHHENHHPKQVLHMFGGGGLVYRKGPLDFGVSYEIPMYGRSQGAKNYVAVFGSYKF